MRGTKGMLGQEDQESEFRLLRSETLSQKNNTKPPLNSK